MYIANVSTDMSIHPHMLTICHRSNKKARTIQRPMACHQTHFALSSMGWQWLRPSTIVRLQFTDNKLQITDNR